MIINGIPVMVSKYICYFAVAKQRRTHHRSRINKKWKKRYGFHETACSGKAYQVNGTMVVCPHVKAQLDKELKK